MREHRGRGGTSETGSGRSAAAPGKRALTDRLPRGGGAPLPEPARGRLEASFGVDLGHVRVRDDGEAAEAATSVGAQAFSLGFEIFLGASAPRDGEEGFELLAHEVAHTLQGGGGGGVGATEDPAEGEADRAAQAAVRGEHAPLAPGSGGVETLRRRPLPGVVGTELGQVGADGPDCPASTVTLHARAELVPSDQQPAAFDGYVSQLQATLRARETGHIGVVVEDADDRWHAYETGVAPVAAPAGFCSARGALLMPRPGVYDMARAVHVFREEAIDFRQAQHQANDLYPQRGPGAFQRAEAAYQRELRAIVGDDVSIGAERMNWDEPGGRRVSSADGAIAVNVDYTNQQGATAQADAGLAGALPADRTSADPEIHRPVFTREGLNDESRNGTEQTLIHEATHEAHGHRVVALRRRWREAGGTIAFDAWLRREHAAGRLDEEETYLALQAIEGRTSATEILARVEAFTSTFHRNPPDDTDAFVQFRTIAPYWHLAEEPVRAHALDRLFHYYRDGLDEPHRRAFDTWIQTPAHFGAGAGNDERMAALGRVPLMTALAGFRARLQP